MALMESMLLVRLLSEKALARKIRDLSLNSKGTRELIVVTMDLVYDVFTV